MATTDAQKAAIVAAQVPADVRAELLRRAEAGDRSVSSLIRAAIIEYLKDSRKQET